MSVDYKGKKSGYLSRVTNAHDGKQYIVSTARVRGGDWQTAVLKPGFFGPFRRLMTIDDLTEQQASRCTIRSRPSLKRMTRCIGDFSGTQRWTDGRPRRKGWARWCGIAILMLN